MITLETPRMTIGQLADHIEDHVEPVRRSTHIGNQPPREMAIMAGLPAGVDVLMVDTIHGRDKYTEPRVINLGDTKLPLVSSREANDRVVGMVKTEEGRSIADIHNEALYGLDLNNHPHVMMDFFSKYPDFLHATIAACYESGQIQRRVVEDGKIVRSTGEEPHEIYGMQGSQEGVLLPLNGMMVMDMLSSHYSGSGSTLHLGGKDMIGYMTDEERLSDLSDLHTRTQALLGITASRHTYRVLDSRGLANAVRSRSQHEMTASGEVVDLSPHLNKNTGLDS